MNPAFHIVLSLLLTLLMTQGCEPPSIQPDQQIERIFLQQITDNQAIVKWRSGATELSTVFYGTNISSLTMQQTGNVAGSHMEAKLTGLTADSTYYYAFDGQPGSNEQSFRTAPISGNLPSDGSVRVWIIGDSGTAGNSVKAVRDSYYNYNNNTKDADVWLMLGDNAYNNGTDTEYQKAVFNIFPQLLKKTGVWSTIGNHEMGNYGQSQSSIINANTPYLDIFSFPSNAEAGGLSSGTEQYYSFNYSNIHFVCLDSQISARNATKLAAMKTWLTDDLLQNTADWTIVFFHHPPYTKGSHDSDDGRSGTDQPMLDMRREFTPVFDNYGVDLVYSGHSHSIERSYYIGGHTGLSTSFDAVIHGETDTNNTLLSGQDKAYQQITASGNDDKVVYTVAGSSGKVESGSLDHPAHAFAQSILASVVLDITTTTISAKTLDSAGNVIDYFDMHR